jgi:hypothetical protein
MNYELICLTRQKLQENGIRWTPERLFYEAHCFDEKMVNLNTIQHEFEDLVFEDTVPPCVEDLCLSILSGRTFPMEENHEPKKVES